MLACQPGRRERVPCCDLFVDGLARPAAVAGRNLGRGICGSAIPSKWQLHFLGRWQLLGDGPNESMIRAANVQGG